MRKLVITALLVLGHLYAQSVFPPTAGGGGGGGGQYSSASAGYTVGTVFFAPGGGQLATATEANVQAPAPVSGSVGNLAAKLTAAPGAGNTIVFTFRKAGADTTATCSITGASATTCTDTHTFSANAGDLLDIKAVVSGGTVTAGVTLLWSLPGVPGPAGIAGVAGAAGPGYLATSATSLVTAATGSKSFTTQSGLAYTVGARVRATSAGTAEYMEGVVTSYSSTTLVAAMDTASGSGTHADWNLNLAGNVGAAGPAGGGGAINAQTANYTLQTTDNSKVVPFNGTSLTASLPATPPAQPWIGYVRNEHSTDLTVSRNANTINGGTTNITLKQGQSVGCVSDGVSNYKCDPVLAAGANCTLTYSTVALTFNCTGGSGGLADPGSNGVLKRTALNTTGIATAPSDFSAPATSETTSGNRVFTGSIDATGATSTAPLQIGTSLPGTCSVGQLFFKTNATAGQNIYECTATNTWTQQLNSGGTGSVVLTTGSGAPVASCVAPSSSNLAVYLDTTAGDEWFCYATNSWKKVLSVTGSGPYSITGGTGAAPSAPSAGNLTCYFDSSSGTQICLDSSGNAFSMVKGIANPSDTNVINYIDTAGIQHRIAQNSAYATIDSNASAVTQRPTVNFVSGTNATVTCSDNSSANRTDCTVAASAGSSAPTFPVNAQSATYQLLATDFSNFKTIAVASGTFTITMVASGSQPASGTGVWVINYGSGAITLARSGQNLNGGTASLTVPAGSATAPTGAFIVSDATNYFVQLFGAAAAGGTGGTVVTHAGSYTILSTDVGSIQTFTGSGSTATLPSTAPAMPWMVDVKNTNASALTINPNGLTLTGCSSSTSLPQNRDLTIASDGTNYRCSSTVAAADVGLGSVTNDAQTKAAVMPNTAPAAGQLPIGNAGGTAYVPVAVSADCTLASTGALTCTQLNGANLTVTTGGIPSKIAGITTAGLGVPVVGWKSNVTAQSSSQSTVTLATSPTAGDYEIHFNADLNAPCTTGSNSVSFTFNWTDASNARALSTGSLTLPAAQTTASYINGIIPIHVGSGNVTYTSTISGTCSSGTSSYDINAWMARAN